MARATIEIPRPGPGRPRGHARPLLDRAQRHRLRPAGAGVEAAAEPERRLMIAVLDQAIGSFLRVTRDDVRRARDLRTLERWFADEDRAWPFSFLRICEALDLDPARVRAALTGWGVERADFFARRTAAKLSRPRRPHPR